MAYRRAPVSLISLDDGGPAGPQPLVALDLADLGDGMDRAIGEGGRVSAAPSDRRKADKLSLSEEGLAFIQGFEDFKDETYIDEAGHPTIGYGHRLLPGEDEKFKNGIDNDAALELLAKDVKIAEGVVNRLVKPRLSQSQYDALVSLVYNIGGSAFGDSQVLKRLNSGDYAKAAEEMATWRLVTNPTTKKKEVNQGLVTRRCNELRIFGGGPYGINWNCR